MRGLDAANLLESLKVFYTGRNGRKIGKGNRRDLRCGRGDERLGVVLEVDHDRRLVAAVREEVEELLDRALQRAQRLGIVGTVHPRNLDQDLGALGVAAVVELHREVALDQVELLLDLPGERVLETALVARADCKRCGVVGDACFGLRHS